MALACALSHGHRRPERRKMVSEDRVSRRALRACPRPLGRATLYAHGAPLLPEAGRVQLLPVIGYRAPRPARCGERRFLCSFSCDKAAQLRLQPSRSPEPLWTLVPDLTVRPGLPVNSAVPPVPWRSTLATLTVVLGDL